MGGQTSPWYDDGSHRCCLTTHSVIPLTKNKDSNMVEDSISANSSFDILNGCNVNEVMVVQKNTKKLGFFEKFFQLFS